MKYIFSKEWKLIEKAMADECCLELPRLLKNTLVVGEDHRFWNHSGVDYFSLLRAIVGNDSNQLKWCLSIKAPITFSWSST
ncbi:transglycosylase domain-containing protein, partial [Aeromonas veronii]